MQFGDYRIEIIPDTEFRLDGGAMFGVVPRVLWENKCPADELNRIKLNMNCLFIEAGDERVLVETGIGEKWSEKETQIYGIYREKPFAESLFEKTGCRPEDISIVVNTHLHFDHAGGNTKISGQSSVASDQRRDAGKQAETRPRGSVQNRGQRATGSTDKKDLPANHTNQRESETANDQSPTAHRPLATDHRTPTTIPQFPNAP